MAAEVSRLVELANTIPPGTAIWVPDAKAGWIKAVVVSLSTEGLKGHPAAAANGSSSDSGAAPTANHYSTNATAVSSFELEYEAAEEDGSGPARIVRASFSTKDAALPCVRNTTLNEDRIDDLTNLSYLNEAAVLHTIKTRYTDNDIYTYSGLVLASVNPYARLPLYNQGLIAAYNGKQREDLEPHLFSVAEDAFRSMIRDGQNQSIIISGESGAGKTVSARYIMRYFATVDACDLDGSSNGGAKNPHHQSGDGGKGEEAAILGMSSTHTSDTTLTAGSHFSSTTTTTGIEEQVLATNPLLEAFGNAKTTRNDNSSRFGKYIQIFFDRYKNVIVGAAIRTYLLEKTRVVTQAATERNYHIFYQLCAGATDAEREELKLGSSWSHFAYLRQGGTGTIDNVDDASEFNLTRASLKTAGFPPEMQAHIFRIIAAILHIGNIAIHEGEFQKDDECAFIPTFDPSCLIAAELLGLDPTEFARWLVQKLLVARHETVVVKLNKAQAMAARDALAKFLYAALFDFIVERLNETLAPARGSPIATAFGSGDDSMTFIGVLDIYGFERFEHNSFEQFCINYANEKLQHQFNQQVFKLEQELYRKEEIVWSFINFNDNQSCIDLIESRQGVLGLLDEECRFPNGSDKSFLDKILDRLPRISEYSPYITRTSKFDDGTFTIKHFAYDVAYDTAGFLEKNRDLVPTELVQLFENSEYLFLADMIRRHMARSTSMAGSGESHTNPTSATGHSRRDSLGNITATHSRASSSSAASATLDSPVKGSVPSSFGSTGTAKPSTGMVFKASLNALMETIGGTNVHYIRCIKPNERKRAQLFDAPFVIQQLRACGILETIRISAAGYPARWSFSDFFARYRILAPLPDGHDTVSDLRDASLRVLQHVELTSDQFQMGKTRIFLRVGMLAMLEGKRTHRLISAARVIQSHIRRVAAESFYKRAVEAVLRIQTCIRSRAACRLTHLLRCNKAAVTMRQYYSKFVARRNHVASQRAAQIICENWRCFAAKFRLFVCRSLAASIIIQCEFRRMQAKKIMAQFTSWVSIIQFSWKKYNARVQMSQWRVESRSVERLQKTSLALETRLMAAMQAQKAAQEEAQAQASELGVVRGELQSMLGKLQLADEAVEAKTAELATVQNLQDHTRSALMEQKALCTAIKEELEVTRTALDSARRDLELTHAELEEKTAHIAKVELQLNAAQLSVKALEEALEQGNRHSSTSLSTTSLPARREQRPIKDELEARPLAMSNSNNNQHLEPFRHDAYSNVRGDDDDGDEHGQHLAGPLSSPAQSKSQEVQSPRAMKILNVSALEIRDLLYSSGVMDELEECLSRAVIPDGDEPAPQDVILLPSRIIEHWTSVSLRFEGTHPVLLERFRRLLGGVRSILSKTTDDRKCAFWLANLTELLGCFHFAVLIQSDSKYAAGGANSAMPSPLGEGAISNGGSANIIIPATSNDGSAIPTVLLQMRGDVSRLVEDIYRAWQCELFRWFGTNSVSAVLDYQGLSNYAAAVKPTNRFLPAIMAGRVNFNSDISIDVFVASLEELSSALISTTLDIDICQQLLRNLFTHIGAVTFNELLRRKNFCTWKRGIQIQYNLSRLEEWATIRLRRFGIADHALHVLEPLLQAVKLLQLAKTFADVETILDACPRLNPAQIRKILSLYIPDDLEDGPVSTILLRDLAQCASAAESQVAASNDSAAGKQGEAGGDAETLANPGGANAAVPSSQQNLNSPALPVMMDVADERHPPPLHLSIAPRKPRDKSALPATIPPTLWKLFVLT